MTSGECKAHAAECLQLAQTAVSPEQKTLLSDLAREWNLAAQEMEQLEAQEAIAGAKKSAEGEASHNERSPSDQ